MNDLASYQYPFMPLRISLIERRPLLSLTTPSPTPPKLMLVALVPISVHFSLPCTTYLPGYLAFCLLVGS